MFIKKYAMCMLMDLFPQKCIFPIDGHAATSAFEGWNPEPNQFIYMPFLVIHKSLCSQTKSWTDRQLENVIVWHNHNIPLIPFEMQCCGLHKVSK